MHTSGYGFHAQASSLMMAALIWENGLRTFRLVRNHEANRLRQGHAKVNLASLPEEILCIIEDQLASSLYEDLNPKMPFTERCDLECREFQDDFFNSSEYDEAYCVFEAEQSASDDSSTPEEDGDDHYCWSRMYLYREPSDWHYQFSQSTEFQQLHGSAYNGHISRGECIAMKKSIHYWSKVGYNMDVDESNASDMVSKTMQGLREFARTALMEYTYLGRRASRST
jgi:hypothetical protein